MWSAAYDMRQVWNMECGMCVVCVARGLWHVACVLDGHVICSVNCHNHWNLKKHFCNMKQDMKRMCSREQ